MDVCVRFFCVLSLTGSCNLKKIYTYVFPLMCSVKTLASHCAFGLHFFDAKLSWTIFAMLIGDWEFCVGELFSCFPLGDSFFFHPPGLGAEASAFNWWGAPRWNLLNPGTLCLAFLNLPLGHTLPLCGLQGLMLPLCTTQYF